MKEKRQKNDKNKKPFFETEKHFQHISDRISDKEKANV